MPVYFVEDSAAVRAVMAHVKAAELSGKPASATNGGYVCAIRLPLSYCQAVGGSAELAMSSCIANVMISLRD